MLIKWPMTILMSGLTLSGIWYYFNKDRSGEGKVLRRPRPNDKSPGDKTLWEKIMNPF